MTINYYRINTGRYKGMWHVRVSDKGKYFHVGRYDTEDKAIEAVNESPYPKGKKRVEQVNSI